MKTFIEDVVCDSLDAVCEEVKRQLCLGNRVEVQRCTSSPASFLICSFEDKLPVRGKRKHMRVTGYFGST